MLSYAFHPPGTKITIPSDMRYISIYYARTGLLETVSDSTMIPISSLKVMRHTIYKNLYNEATASRSAIDIEISTDLVLTVGNSNYGVLIIGHY